MLGSLRGCGLLVIGLALAGGGDRSAPAQGPPQAPAGGPPQRLAPEAYALPGEDPPHGFVPAQPRTAAEARRVESLRFYAEARAAEDRRQYRDAAQLLEKALAADPDSVACLRRLSRIQFALGREAEAIALCRRIIGSEPGDVETVALLVDHFRDDLPAAEGLLKGVLANPKLDRNSTGALYLHYELGSIYEATLRFGPAADELARVVDALDEKANARLAPSDLRRFLGNDEGQAYLRFGRVFLQARRFDLAIRALRRGLIYDEDGPLLLHYLAQAYLEAGRNEEALATLEQFLRRQPQGRENYDLLARILVSLKREKDIVPLLEKYAANDPRNTPLQYALAEQYRAAGQPEKAKAVLGKILDEQRITQNFAEVFPALVRDRKTEDLLVLLARVVERTRRVDAVADQIKDLGREGAYTDEVLDAGLRLMTQERPPFNPEDAWLILVNIAAESHRNEKLVALLRWSLNRMPSPIVYRHLAATLFELKRLPEAEQALRELFDRFRDERNAPNLLELAKIQARAERFAEAIATVQEALRLAPNDTDVLGKLALYQNQMGKPDDAIATLRAALKGEPNNLELVYQLGSTLGQNGQNDEAIRVFREMIERNPGNDRVHQAARSALSTIYTNMGDFARGEAELEALLGKTPDDPTVNNDLGYLYADQGKNLAKAEGMIRKAIQDEPDNTAFLDSLGWVLFKQGRVEEARVSLEKATSNLDDEDATKFDHLGDVYFRLQEPAKARSAWERAVQLATRTRQFDKRLPEIRKKLQALQETATSPRPIGGNTP